MTTTSTANYQARTAETRRRYFLGALGVDLYWPKETLPGAKAIERIEPLTTSNSPSNNATRATNVQEVAKQFVSKSQSAATSPVDKGETETTVSPVRNSPINKLEINVESTTRKSTQQAQAADTHPPTALRFQLRAWRVANDLLVVDSREGDIALPTETLLRNIIIALGYSTDDLNKGENLRWPISKSANAVNDPEVEEADARAMVQAFIEAQQQRYAFTKVILMGDSAKRFALAPSADSEYEPWQTVALLENCQAILLPSLNKLLRQPELKRNTWKAIRPLCRIP